LKAGIDHLINVAEKAGQQLRELKTAIRSVHEIIEPDQPKIDLSEAIRRLK